MTIKTAHKLRNAFLALLVLDAAFFVYVVAALDQEQKELLNEYFPVLPILFGILVICLLGLVAILRLKK